MHEQDPEDHGREPEAERPPEAPPSIWVGSLADYTNGVLHGDWLDATQDEAELRAGIQQVLDTSPTAQQTGEPAEEWAIFDFDGFGQLRLDEHDDLAWVSRVAQGIAEHGLAFAAWAEAMDDEESLAGFEGSYLGHYASLEDWAREVLDDSVLEAELDRAVPDSLRGYVSIDYAGFARDCQFSGDIYVEPSPDGGVWIFSTK